MTRLQHTIAGDATVTGKGLHTGKHVTVTFHPAPANHGIIFRRVDLPGQPLVHPSVANVFDTSRGTSVMENNAAVRTIEHLMAALAGLRINNVLIDIDAEETPILDGSSRLYVEALQATGLKEQDQSVQYIILDKPVTFENAEKGIQLCITPADDFSIDMTVDYGTQILAEQKAVLHNIDEFVPEIYKCRTFVFLHELQFLIMNNLVKGGDVDNAIVFVAQKPEQAVLDQLAVFFGKSDIKVMENGILNNIQLYFDNEPARHKLLDLVGDLYLLGGPILGHVVAKKTGHWANVEFGKNILLALK